MTHPIETAYSDDAFRMVHALYQRPESGLVRTGGFHAWAGPPKSWNAVAEALDADALSLERGDTDDEGFMAVPATATPSVLREMAAALRRRWEIGKDRYCRRPWYDPQ